MAGHLGIVDFDAQAKIRGFCLGDKRAGYLGRAGAHESSFQLEGCRLLRQLVAEVPERQIGVTDEYAIIRVGGLVKVAEGAVVDFHEFGGEYRGRLVAQLFRRPARLFDPLPLGRRVFAR